MENSITKENNNLNEIIKISQDGERITVLARNLHEFLEVGTEFRHWFPRMSEYGFEEILDYTPVIFDHPQNGQPTTDYQMTIEMAKEIAMLQRNEKGKIARQYFIELEKSWNSPEKVIARALVLAQKELESVKFENYTMKPKAQYFDCLVERNLLLNFRDTAKELKVKAKEFNNFLLDSKYVYRDKKGQLKPYADYVENGLFEIKEFVSAVNSHAGNQTLITPKGRETFRMLLQVMA